MGSEIFDVDAQTDGPTGIKNLILKFRKFFNKTQSTVLRWLG
jgi:hypothetical protein